MSTLSAPNNWPASSEEPAAASWRFERGLGKPSRDTDIAVMQWTMSRNSSFSSGQMLAVYLSLCVVALVIGVAFWWLGAPAVLPLAGIELSLLGLAFWTFSQHAHDAETVTLAARELQVESRNGRRVQRAAFRAEWVRIEPEHGEGSLVELSGQGQRMCIGRYLRPEQRAALARELRQALRSEYVRTTNEQMRLGQQG